VFTPFIKPIVPIEISSEAVSGFWFEYFFAIWATSLKLWTMSLFLASMSLLSLKAVRYFSSSSGVSIAVKELPPVTYEVSIKKDEIKKNTKIPPIRRYNQFILKLNRITQDFFRRARRQVRVTPKGASGALTTTLCGKKTS